MGQGKNEKEILTNAGFGCRMGFGTAPALLAVDFSKGYTSAESPLGGDYHREIEQSKRIIDIMRKKKMPVIFTNVVYQKNMKDCGVWRLKYPTAECLTNPAFAKIDERLEFCEDTDTLVTKKGASAFFGTNLSAILAAQRVDTVIIVGLVTSGCIRASAVDSCQYGYRTIVPRECVGDRAPAPHEANLFDIDTKYGDVVSVEDVIAYLETLD